MVAPPSMLFFGPQAPWPAQEVMLQLREILLRDPRLRSLLCSIKELSDLWHIMAQRDPELRVVRGAEALKELDDWINHGQARSPSGASPNISCMPLTVIVQLLQYFHFIEHNDQGLPHTEVIKAVSVGGVQGFCIGLLSAVVVAASRTEEDVSVLGGVAVRLAMCVGAYVDLDAARGCSTSSLAVRWGSSEGHSQVTEVLKGHPDAYISVVRDITDVNVTAPTASVDSLLRAFAGRGIAVKPTGIEGRCHSTENIGAYQKIAELCAARPGLSFPSATHLLVPVCSNADAQVLGGRPLHELLLRNILCDVSNWYLTATTAVSKLINTTDPTIVTFGLIDGFPSSLARDAALTILKWKTTQPAAALPCPETGTPIPGRRYPENAVAVVGMACKFPGANSLEEFWDVISEGRSMCREMPESRFSTKGLRRSADGKLKFWGNFVDDADAFDHRFFKKSGREAASMDPQQRMLLQVAYAAMENSGYFAVGAEDGSPRDVGVYIGACSNDYNDNVASHKPTAFSSLGTLRAFLSGRISHWFNWTGPSITYDTACSSSAVAIDAACKALQLGECSQAVAGGVSLYTNPNFYQNLAAASFLSPTGPTKPFDASADGYCRGEGAGLVVLKKLSAALADGDTVIGVIASSAVNQNQNSTYITVPHGDSQQQLYRKVVGGAAVRAEDVSYVEAHGTGTPVGDPIEFDSIRNVFSHGQQLAVGSVKGNIGHLEGAAGIASLIKVCLMLQKKTLPVQANFKTMNPKIAGSGTENMLVPTATVPWSAEFRVACINNYGAAGSNAAMIVCEAPDKEVRKMPQLPKYPIYMSAGTDESLRAFCAELGAQVKKTAPGSDGDGDGDNTIVSSISHALARTQSRSLPCTITSTVSTTGELLHLLAAPNNAMEQAAQAKPVVLCFGGQVRSYVGLSREVYESCGRLRDGLDRVDAALGALGLPGIYPAIFQRSPVDDDVVRLHAVFFAMQYASARASIEAGLPVAGVIGHSFGQLTALAVSGALSLEDGLRLVCGRAALMKQHWGAERGAMLSVDADLATVLDGTAGSGSGSGSVEVACFNGDASHVLVGPVVEVEAAHTRFQALGVSARRLPVSHGFHSHLTEPLLPHLAQLAAQLAFREPSIPLETCSKDRSWPIPTPQLIVEHTRSPVYFTHAVRRLAARLPAGCAWVEAGSSSGITSMVRRALPSEQQKHTFVPARIADVDDASALANLADTTVALWKAGHRSARFWPYDRRPLSASLHVNPPPYQFEKSRHWLPWIDYAAEGLSKADAAPPSEDEKKPAVLLRFVGYQDQNRRSALFHVDPSVDEYKLLVEGHAVLAEPLCPAPLYAELAVRSAAAVSKEADVGAPAVEGLEIKMPLGLDPSRFITLNLEASDDGTGAWHFEVSSKAAKGDVKAVSHATGRVRLVHDSSKLQAEFARYQRLVGFHRFAELEADPDADALKGSMIYRVFSRVVLYAPYYKGVRNVCAKDHHVAGTVRLPPHDLSALNDMVTNPLAVDNFFQVAGLHVNSLNECAPGEVMVCTKIDSIHASPHFRNSGGKTSWLVYSSYTPSNDREAVNDVFVFDADTKQLVFIGLGARFTRTSVTGLARVLGRANSANVASPTTTKTPLLLQNRAKAPPALPIKPTPISSPISFSAPLRSPVVRASRIRPKKTKKLKAPGRDVLQEVKVLLNKVSEVAIAEIKEDSTLDDLGIDSLMVMEVQSEVESTFKIEIPNFDWQKLGTPKLLSDYLAKRVQGGSREAISSSSSSFGSSSDVGEAETDTSSVTSVEEVPVAVQKPKPQRRSPPPTTPKPLALRSASISPAPSPPATPAPRTEYNAQQAFEDVRFDYDVYAAQTGFANFWRHVYPEQARLTLAYTVEAFAQLGCPLDALSADALVPHIKGLARHEPLINQLYIVLEDGGLVYSDGVDVRRTQKLIDHEPASSIFQHVVRKFPQHTAEHRLLNLTGSRLSDCLTGAADPLKLLFADRANKDLLEDVYTNGPMYKAITKLLGEFLLKVGSVGEPLHILELGGGTGGTTKYVVDYLTQRGVKFTYTFSDLSGALVASARKKFAGRSNMNFTVIDIEKAPPAELLGKHHVVLSTNCIHATRNLTRSASNIRQLLRPDGFVSLVEFTRNIFWFDLVFGLLDGWWLFEDGRKHVLADQWFWDSSLRAAGFGHVAWTDGTSEEARTLRIITAFANQPQNEELRIRRASLRHSRSRSGQSSPSVATVQWKNVDGVPLLADIYYPPADQVSTSTKRPVGMILDLLDNNLL
ncbi:Beta-ketoacyl synthase [Macrophomina phaseolina MS6]|uniref:Beta-ketoacyl synthase n=1 Tax=Macrophomina phaseolina (strain MS6) TaxID=1126212 RepID=K2RYW9_MACPH|nr:Beta-ketoacyl synthase [Macrophomina phaseolina MS6]